MCDCDLQLGFDALLDLLYQIGPEYERRLLFAEHEAPQDEFFIEAAELNKIMDEQEFWDKVEKIAEEVDTWPQWKKEGWAILDKREDYPTSCPTGLPQSTSSD